MKAVTVRKPGGADQLGFDEFSIPRIGPGDQLIKV